MRCIRHGLCCPTKRASRPSRTPGQRDTEAIPHPGGGGSGGALPQTPGQKYRLIYLSVLCGEWGPEPSRPQSLCALADECRAPRSSVATAAGEGACFWSSCPRATRARSRRYVLRPPCLWHVLQPQTEVCIARSGCRRRGVCHMPLPGGGTTRIKRCQSIWSNHTPRSMRIRRAMVHFGGMGSPNIYVQPIALGPATAPVDLNG